MGYTHQRYLSTDKGCYQSQYLRIPGSVRIRVYQWLGAFILCISSASLAAELSVGREFPYPSGYTEPQVQVSSGANGSSGVAIIGPSPSGFAVREIGTRLRVNASVGDASSSVQVAKNGNTDLMISASEGNLARVQQLLNDPVDVNAKNQWGSTALMGAAAGGHLEIVKLLLDRKADVNSMNKNGCTALIFAARNGHKDLVELLLHHGADKDQTDQYHQTALMHAIAEGHKDVAKLLIKKGTDVNVTSSWGATAQTTAKAKGDLEIVAMLQEAGAGK